MMIWTKKIAQTAAEWPPPKGIQKTDVQQYRQNYKKKNIANDVTHLSVVSELGSSGIHLCTTM